MAEAKHAYRILLMKSLGNRPLGRRREDGMIILRCILK
jgi:hypothetical protein